MCNVRVFLQVAEKRKSLLDELAIKYQKELDSHREQVKSMEEARSKEVEDLTMKLDDAEVGIYHHTARGGNL